MLNCILLVFFFIFSPAIVGVPLNTGKLVVLLLAFRQLVVTIGRGGSLPVFREVRYHTAIIFMMFVVSVGFFAAQGGVDFLLPYAYLVNIVENLLGSILLIYFFSRRNISIERFFWILACAFIIQAIIMLISLVVEPVRNLFFSINADGNTLRSIYDRYHGIRGVGFSSGVTFDLSSAFFFIIVMMVYSYAECKMSALKFYLSFGFMVLGIVIAGRTGLLGMILFVPLILYKVFFSRQNAKRLAYFKIVLYCSLALVVSIFLLSIAVPDKFKQITDFAFELFVNAQDGSAHTDSTDTLLGMLSKRISYETLLIGDGRWVDRYNPTAYYNHVDVGYYRHIFYYGIFATLLSVMAFVAIPIVYARKLREAGLLPFVCCLICFYLLVEVKGDFIWGSAMNMKLLNMALLSVIYLKSPYFGPGSNGELRRLSE